MAGSAPSDPRTRGPRAAPGLSPHLVCRGPGLPPTSPRRKLGWTRPRGGLPPRPELLRERAGGPGGLGISRYLGVIRSPAALSASKRSFSNSHTFGSPEASRRVVRGRKRWVGGNENTGFGVCVLGYLQLHHLVVWENSLWCVRLSVLCSPCRKEESMTANSHYQNKVQFAPATFSPTLFGSCC